MTHVILFLHIGLLLVTLCDFVQLDDYTFTTGHYLLQ